MFFDTVYRYRSVVLVLSALLVIAAGFGVSRLSVSTDNRIFYGSGNRYYQDLLHFEDEFTSDDNVLFVLHAPFTIDQQDYPSAIRWLTDEAAGLSHAIRVDSLANYPHPASDKGELSVESLLDWGCPTGRECRPELTEAISDAHLINRLVSKDRKSTGVVATVSVERGAVGEIEALESEVKGLAEKFHSQFPRIEIYYTGGVPMMAAFAQATSDDLGTLLPVALLAISVLLIFVLGSARLAAAIIALGLLSIMTTLGLAGWSGHILNNATSIVPLIVFTLVVTSSMHIAVHYSRNVGHSCGPEKAVAQARASVSSSLLPIGISAATSAASLCSLWFVDSPPLRQLGLLSALGVAIGFGFTVTLLPLLLVRVHGVSETRMGAVIQFFVNRYARRQELGHDVVVVPTVLLLALSGGLALLSVNDDFVKFFDKSVPFRIQTDMATELLAGPNHIEVLLTNPNGSVFDPPFIRYLSKLTETLRTAHFVANAHSFSDVMDQVSKAFDGRPISAIDSTEQMAQLFLVYELSLRIGQSNTDLINAAQDSARVSVLLKETTSSQIQQLERSLYSWHESTHSPYTLTVTGENIPVAHLSSMNIRSMVRGIFLSLAFTAVVIGAAFKSVRLGVVALLATVLPVLAGFGGWGWINREIGLAATAILALTIGVVVDDAAHYMYRFLDAYNRLEMDGPSAAAYATYRAGTAIVSSSVVMGLGLSVLLLSSFEVNSAFGAVTCLIISTALLFNIFLLPRLTVWASSKHPRNVESFA